MHCTGPSKGYLTTEDRISPTSFYKPNLLGGSISFDVNISETPCGCIASFYQVEMPARNGNGFVPGSDNDYYCDANGVGGSWCPEFDIMLANNEFLYSAPHDCSAPDAGRYDWCDQAGTPALHINSYEGLGTKGTKIETRRTFNVKVEYVRGADDILKEATITLT